MVLQTDFNSIQPSHNIWFTCMYLYILNIRKIENTDIILIILFIYFWKQLPFTLSQPRHFQLVTQDTHRQPCQSHLTLLWKGCENNQGSSSQLLSKSSGENPTSNLWPFSTARCLSSGGAERHSFVNPVQHLEIRLIYNLTPNRFFFSTFSSRLTG